MDFGLNEQQEMMQSLARDFLADEYTDKVLKASVAEDEHNPELWKKVAALNLTGLGIPEEYGGVGDFLDLTVVLEEMGRACFISPFFSSVVLGASTILEAGNATQKQQYLPDIAEGKSIFTLALTEESGHFSPEDIKTVAVRRGNGYIINGRKVFVPDARTADYLICATRTSQDNGITLFILDINTKGISINPLTMISGDKMAEVLFDNVEVSPEAVLGDEDKGWFYLEKVLQKASVAKCAELVGLSRQVLDITLDYAKERIAFGHPIGAFQSIQHRCADMLIDTDASRFLTYQAAWRINAGLPSARETAIAKAWVSQASRRVMKSAHQVHGAIGFTEDHILHYYTKKARAGESAFGDADYHFSRLLTLV
jgi:alkylation response protein AidB-like acyl-CoA dehydrogenase